MWKSREANSDAELDFQEGLAAMVTGVVRKAGAALHVVGKPLPSGNTHAFP